MDSVVVHKDGDEDKHGWCRLWEEGDQGEWRDVGGGDAGERSRCGPGVKLGDEGVACKSHGSWE